MDAKCGVCTCLSAPFVPLAKPRPGLAYTFPRSLPDLNRVFGATVIDYYLVAYHFRANPAVVREIVRGGGKDKEELLDAIGLAQSTLGSRSLWKDSRSLTMIRISIVWGRGFSRIKRG